MALGLDVQEGYDWLATTNDPQDNVKLKLTANPQVTIPDHSIGTLQLKANEIIDIVASGTTTANRKNFLLNGGFDFWQRGISFSANVSPDRRYFTADRWATALSNPNRTISRGVMAFGGNVPPGWPQYYLRWVQAAASAPVQYSLRQFIEGVRTLAGKTTTLSFWMSVDTPCAISARLVQDFGGGGSPSADVATANQSFSANGAAWTRVQRTFVVPDVLDKTLGTDGDDFLEVRLTMPSDAPFDIKISNIQLEEGDHATPFEIVDSGTQLRDLQRYYEIIKARLSSSITTNTPVIFFKEPKRILAQPNTLSIVGDASTPYAIYYTALDTGSAYQSLAHALATTTLEIDAEFN